MEGELPSQRITEGVIWKQLLFFFFPILLGSFFQQIFQKLSPEFLYVHFRQVRQFQEFLLFLL